MAEDEEVAMELEAVQAVYGEDCVVLDSYPAHLHLHIKPRTAEVSSRQFVEAVISIRAGSKIDIIESKSLDDQGQKHLISSIKDKAHELSSCLMLVALCEESVEKLSAMNHPGGDCPLCLNPLFPTEEHKVLPFMKLMSCFHCFYSECIIRWWNWLQDEKETFVSSATAHPNGDIGIQKSSDGCEIDDNDDKLLHSDLENIPRQKFEAILKLQQENSGLIEPKRDLVVLPGMFLPQPPTFPTPTSPREMAEQEQREPPLCSERNPSSFSIKPSSSRRWDSGWRKQRVRNNPRKQVRQWIRKDNNTGD